MKSLILLFTICLFANTGYSQCSTQVSDSLMLDQFFKTALSQDKAYMDMHDICKQCGSRLSGSAGADKAVTLVHKIMNELGVDTVWLQPVMVPHWVRGAKEEAYLNSTALKIKKQSMPVCALGGSIGTPKEGITAKVIEVKGMGQLKKLNPADIKGKIVFYDEPFDQTYRETFNAYGKAVKQRWGGAMEAAQFGAVGVVIRSMAQHVDDWPHTGSMGYADTIPKIPEVALSTRAAEELSADLKKDKNLTVTFKSSCETLPDTQSYNVICELRGTEHPDHIIVMGGHLDSWDLSESAQDDAAGVVQSIDALRMIKSAGIKPKNTIRVVAFMNEENGGRGGSKFAEWAKTSGEKFVAAIESDAGGFTPRGFSLVTSDAERAYIIMKWKPLMDEFQIGELSETGAGADVEPLSGICSLTGELHPDSQRYFDFHHTGHDTWENCNDRELESGAAAMASFIYLIDKYGLGN